MSIQLRILYRQVVAYRYVIISILAITFVLLLSWTEEAYLYPSPKTSQSDVKVSTIVEGQGRRRRERRTDVDHVTEARRVSETPMKTHCPDQGQMSQVILLTYGRSGSSLTGDILQQHDDVFFNYEPLHNLAKSFSPIQKLYEERYQKHLYLTAIPDYNQQAEKVCELLLTCNYTHLPVPAYRNLHLIRSKNTKPLQGCIRRADGDDLKIHDCLKLNSKLCKLTPLQLIKTIRMSAESVGPLMTRLPNLKLIYLVRDPRGSYLSKLKAFPRDFSRNATYEALRICPRYKKDVDATLKLYKKYPSRVHITRYESIAEDPMEMSRRLYKFLCLEFDKSAQRYIQNHVIGGTNDTERNIYATRRQNPKAAAYAWRMKMNTDNAMAFDEICSDVYEKLGYLPVDNEEHLRDLDTPLKLDVEDIL